MTDDNSSSKNVVDTQSDETASRHTSPLPTKGSETSIDGGLEHEGTVVWFGSGKGRNNGPDNRGSTKSFGFIEWSENGAQQPDMFVHFSNIVAPDGTYRTLIKGQRVRFQIGTNHHAMPKAIFVRVIE